MKIAVSATGPSLDVQVEPRFGRCQYFIIINPDTMEFEVVNNSGAMAGGGVGISTAQMIVGKGVDAILTGHCGPNAFQVLTTAGVNVTTDVSGTVQDAVRDYKEGKYRASSQPNVPGHFGMGRGRSAT